MEIDSDFILNTTIFFVIVGLMILAGAVILRNFDAFITAIWGII